MLENLCCMAIVGLVICGPVVASTLRFVWYWDRYTRVSPGEELTAAYPIRLLMADGVPFASLGLPQDEPIRQLFFAALRHGTEQVRLCFTDRGRMLIEVAWAHRAIFARETLWFEDCGPAVPLELGEGARRIRVWDARGAGFEIQLQQSGVDALRRWATS